MSLFNQNWITFDGKPVTGKVPPRTVIHAAPGVVMTPAQESAVAHAFKLFTDAVKVSPHVGMYHTQHRKLADGTKVRMISNGGVEVVEVWPVGGPGDGLGPSMFFCIPFDETYVATPEQDTYYSDHFGSDSSATPEKILKALTKSAKYRFIPMNPDGEGGHTLAKLSHPGNQTWFANTEPKHKHSHYVVSWWGNPNRYNYAPLDASLATGGVRIQQESWTGFAAGTRDVKAHAWTDAMDGVRYRPYSTPAYPGGSSPPFAQKVYPYSVAHTDEYPFPPFPNDLALPEVTTNAGNAAVTETMKTSVLNAVWINGERFITDFEVHSACIGERDDETVLRIYTLGFGAATVREFPLSVTSGGAISFGSATTYSASFPAIPSAGAYSIDHACHPFYWSADGDEAMGLFAFRVPVTTAGKTHFYSGTALLKLAMTEAGFACTLMEASAFAESETLGGDIISPLFWTTSLTEDLSFDQSASRDYSCELSYVLCADYRGNLPVVVKASINETLSSSVGHTFAFSENYSNPSGIDAGFFSGDTSMDGPISGVVTSDPMREEVASYALAVTTTSRVFVSGVEATGLTDTSNAVEDFYIRRFRQATSEKVMTSHSYIVPATGATGYYSTSVVDTTTFETLASNGSISRTGKASMWAIAGGDVRGGKLVLRESPWTSMVGHVKQPNCWMNMSVSNSLDYELSNNNSHTEYNSSSSNIVTASSAFFSTNKDGSCSGSAQINAGAGRFLTLDVASSAVESVSGLVHADAWYMQGSYASSGGGSGSSTTAQPVVPDVSMTFTNLESDTSAGILPAYTNVTTTFQNMPVSVRAFSKPTHNPRFSVGKSRGINSTYMGAGGFSDVAFSSGAVSKDGKIQYIGLVSVALSTPGSKAVTTPHKIDVWFKDGALFNTETPNPKNGEYGMLSCPIFTGRARAS